ncbi:MAG: C2H2-type zinc finger protein [Halolamina sp.]
MSSDTTDADVETGTEAEVDQRPDGKDKSETGDGDPAPTALDPSLAVPDFAVAAETTVPADESPARCGYCKAPFPTDRVRDLHVGRAHAGAADEAERERYADGVRTERDDLRSFRLRALAALVLLYFGFLFVYAGIQ